jgi:hypothetical protein
MPTRTLLSPEQRTRLFSIPTDTAGMARHYVLDANDLALVGARRRASNRLGFAVQLCMLRHPGRVLDLSESPPVPMLAFVATQVGVDPALFGEYARRAETRREHLLELQRLLRLRSFGLRRLADLSSGRHGRGVGHGSRRTHRPGNARPPAIERRPASLGDSAGANWPGSPCTRAKEDLRDPRGRTVRLRAFNPSPTHLPRSSNPHRSGQTASKASPRFRPSFQAYRMPAVREHRTARLWKASDNP